MILYKITSSISFSSHSFVSKIKKKCPTTLLDVCENFANKQNINKLKQRIMDDFLKPDRI